MSAQSVLVVGAGGFLGTAVARALSAVGRNVVSVGRIARPAMPGEALVHMSLPDPALTSLVASMQPQACVHVAGPASVPASLLDPAADLRNTLDPWLAVLEALRLGSPGTRVLLVSSAAVYGQPARLPVSETDSVAPVSPYGFHRLYAEQLLTEYTQLYGLRGAAARVFSAYGEGLQRQVVWDICRMAAQGLPIRLHGTGDESRDFIHCDDVASALLCILQSDALDGQYNVATGVETRIAALAGMVARLVPALPEVTFAGDAEPGKPLRWAADIRRLTSAGFRPAHSLEEALPGILAQCRKAVKP